jgi:hypothetical protein
MGCWRDCPGAIHICATTIHGRRKIGNSEVNLLGKIARSESNYSLARQYYNEALAIAQNLGNQLLICLQLGNLGVTTLRLGDVSQARKLFVDTLTSAREIGLVV